MKKLNDFETVYDMIEHALELAFEGKMQLKFYEFLKYRKTTKIEIDSFLNSSTATELVNEVKDLQEYTEVKMDRLMRDKIHPNTLVGTKGFLEYVKKMTPGYNKGVKIAKQYK